MEPLSSIDLTKQAIALKKAGDTAGAIPLLVQALNTTPNLEAAWLWLAACLTEPSERRYCLAQALIANPDSQQARAGLVRFEGYASVRPAVLGAEPIELPPDIAPLPVVTPTQPLTPPKPRRSAWPIVFFFAVIGILIIGGGTILLLSNVGASLGISLGANIQATVQAAVQQTAEAQQVAVSISATQTASEACGQAALTAYADAVDDEIKTFNSQLSVADTTPRMSIGVPLQKLLDLQTETRHIQTPPCLKAYHERLVGMMGLYRYAYETFAAQGQESMIQASMQLGAQEKEALMAGLPEIRAGKVPALPTLTPTPTGIPGSGVAKP